MVNLKLKDNSTYHEVPRSAGIADDYAVRKNVATKEGTIEQVPTNDNHIVNKKYVDDAVSGVVVAETDPLSLHLDQTTPQTIINGSPQLNNGLTAGTIAGGRTAEIINNDLETAGHFKSGDYNALLGNSASAGLFHKNFTNVVGISTEDYGLAVQGDFYLDDFALTDGFLKVVGGVVEVASGAGVTAHSDLTELDFASAGHTGFQASLGFTPVNKAGDTMTGNLTLTTGTATAGTSPLKFVSGTLMTATETGAMEFLTDDYYLTMTSAGAFTSQYPPSQSDTYVKATSKWSTSYESFYSTDPTKSLTGAQSGNGWMSVSGSATNQRYHIDLGSAKAINKIYYENLHISGASTNSGAKNFTFWGSNDASAFAELTYATDTNWTQLTTSQGTFDIHASADVPDPKYITVTNTTGYRYYAVKIADRWSSGGNATVGIRRIELQSGGDAGRNPIIVGNGTQLTNTYIPIATTNGRLTNSNLTQDGAGNINVTDAKNIVLATTTGTKIGTATTQKLGFYNVTPIVQPSAYTQTYSTALKTNPNVTSANLSTTATTQVTPFGFATQAQGDAIATQVNATQADVLALKKLVNSIIDDLQALGLAS